MNATSLFKNVHEIYSYRTVLPLNYLAWIAKNSSYLAFFHYLAEIAMLIGYPGSFLPQV